MNINEVVNIREGKDGKILVSSIDSGRVKVKRFFLDKCPVERCKENRDAVYQEDEDGTSFVSVISLPGMRRKYPNMNEDEAVKLCLYLTARAYAALIANQRNAALIDRTQGLNDLPYASKHFQKREAEDRFWKARTEEVHAGIRG